METTPIITNLVLKFVLPFEIDSKDLHKIYSKVDYRPRRFNGAIVKTPINCMLIFRNGKVNVVGNRTEKDAYDTVLDLAARLSYPCHSVHGLVVNIVAACSLGMNLQLNKISEDGEFEYNPEIYPAAYYNSTKGKVAIFHTGKLIFTGFKNVEELYFAYDEVKLAINIRLLDC